MTAARSVFVSGGGISVLDGEPAFLQIGIWQTVQARAHKKKWKIHEK